MSALPSVTTFPALPRASRPPAPTVFTPAAPASPVPAAILRSLRRLGRRLDRLAAPRRAARLERRLRRAARRGTPFVLGTPERPYEPEARVPWEILGSAAGLAVRVTTRSPEILRELPVLAALDRRHAVAVDVVVGDPDRAPRRLRAVEGLAAEGIATRVLLRPRASSTLGEDRLRSLFAAARRAGAVDLRLVGRRSAWARRFRRLRLEHGFPRPQPCRG